MLSISHTSEFSRGSSESGIGDWLPIDQRVEELKMKYATTIEDISVSLKQKITSEMIFKKLQLFPPDLRNLKSYLQVYNSKNDDLFAELIHAINFQHIEILQELMKEFGNEKCKRVLALYEEDLRTFNMETTLGECSKSWSRISSEQAEVQLLLGGKWENKTLHDFYEFKKKLQRRAHFDSYSLNLCKVESPCLELSLAMASATAQSSNMKLVDKEFYKANNVLRVSLGGDIIYHVESPKVTIVLLPLVKVKRASRREAPSFVIKLCMNNTYIMVKGQ